MVDRLAPDRHQGRTRGLRREQSGNGVAGHEGMIARRWRLRASRPTLAGCACASSGPGRSAACSRRAWPSPARRSASSRGARRSPRIRDTGLTLVEPDGSVVVVPAVDVSDDLAGFGPQDVVVLSLKAHQIAAVADQLEALYDESTIVVPVQNGVPWWFFQKWPGPFQGRRLQSLDPDGTIERHIPPDRIVGGIAYPAAEREEPAVIRLVEGDRFPVGELDGSRSERVAALAQTLTAAGFTSRVLTDIRAHLWVKAWGNLAFNPISALTGATLVEICQLPSTRELAATMMREAGTVAERLGLRLRISVEQRIEGAEKVGAHKTSMLQDVEAGRPLEIAPLIGAFVELGRLTGTPMPATESVHALVSLLDRATAQGGAMSGSGHVEVSGLRVDPALHDFVISELVPGSGVTADQALGRAGRPGAGLRAPASRGAGRARSAAGADRRLAPLPSRRVPRSRRLPDVPRVDRLPGAERGAVRDRHRGRGRRDRHAGGTAARRAVDERPLLDQRRQRAVGFAVRRALRHRRHGRPARARSVRSGPRRPRRRLDARLPRRRRAARGRVARRRRALLGRHGHVDARRRALRRARAGLRDAAALHGYRGAPDDLLRAAPGAPRARDRAPDRPRPSRRRGRRRGCRRRRARVGGDDHRRPRGLGRHRRRPGQGRRVPHLAGPDEGQPDRRGHKGRPLLRAHAGRRPRVPRVATVGRSSGGVGRCCSSATSAI